MYSPRYNSAGIKPSDFEEAALSERTRDRNERSHLHPQGEKIKAKSSVFNVSWFHFPRVSYILWCLFLDLYAISLAGLTIAVLLSAFPDFSIPCLPDILA